MRRHGIKFTAVALVAALLGASAIVGAQAPLRAAGLLERTGLRGHVSFVHFRPLDAAKAGCQSEAQKFLALSDYAARKGSALAGLFGPTAAFASPKSALCTVLLAWSRLPNLIVNEGETALRDCFNANAGNECGDVIDNLNFHGLGTNATAAAEADTGCGTELTTQYNPDNTRATGSQTTNGANVYRTVGTNTVDASATVTEFCLESAATGAVVTWSHIVFSSISLAPSDSLQTAYDLTSE